MSKNLHKMSAAHMPALLMLILLALFPARLSAEVGDIFKYTYDGQPIKYIILSEDEKTVATNPGELTRPGNDVLGSLVLPSKVVNGDTEYTLVEIGDHSFERNYGLTSITIPESVTTIGNAAFYLCTKMNNITIPNSVTTIGSQAFNECYRFDNITIPNSVTSIGGAAFSLCRSLKSVTISNSVTSIASSTFSHCEALSSVIIPESVTSIGDYAFNECSALSSVTIPESVTSIDDCAFSYCKALRSITIPNSVTSIGKDAFVFCSALNTVTIGNSVTTIGEGAFSYCKNLKNVYTWAINPPALEDEVFYSSYSYYATLHVPAESVDAYSKAEQWEDFGKILGDVESSGIEGIEVDGSNSPAEYFNLNGVRVANPENGLYIKRQGGKATKVLVK